MIPCKHRIDGCCQIACTLANVANVPTYEKSCDVCSHEDSPQTVNRVTIGLSLLHLRKTNQFDLVKHAYLTNAVTEANHGVGTVLKRKLQWIAAPNQTCDCESKVRVMNAWGPEKCREEIETILDWLQESAEEQKILFVRFAVKILVLAAIQEARKL